MSPSEQDDSSSSSAAYYEDVLNTLNTDTTTTSKKPEMATSKLNIENKSNKKRDSIINAHAPSFGSLEEAEGGEELKEKKANEQIYPSQLSSIDPQKRRKMEREFMKYFLFHSSIQDIPLDKKIEFLQNKFSADSSTDPLSSSYSSPGFSTLLLDLVKEQAASTSKKKNEQEKEVPDSRARSVPENLPHKDYDDRHHQNQNRHTRQDYEPFYNTRRKGGQVSSSHEPYHNPYEYPENHNTTFNYNPNHINSRIYDDELNSNDNNNNAIANMGIGAFLALAGMAAWRWLNGEDFVLIPPLHSNTTTTIISTDDQQMTKGSRENMVHEEDENENSCSFIEDIVELEGADDIIDEHDEDEDATTLIHSNTASEMNNKSPEETEEEDDKNMENSDHTNNNIGGDTRSEYLIVQSLTNEINNLSKCIQSCQQYLMDQSKKEKSNKITSSAMDLLLRDKTASPVPTAFITSTDKDQPQVKNNKSDDNEVSDTTKSNSTTNKQEALIHEFTNIRAELSKINKSILSSSEKKDTNSNISDLSPDETSTKDDPDDSSPQTQTQEIVKILERISQQFQRIEDEVLSSLSESSQEKLSISEHVHTLSSKPTSIIQVESGSKDEKEQKDSFPTKANISSTPTTKDEGTKTTLPLPLPSSFTSSKSQQLTSTIQSLVSHINEKIYVRDTNKDTKANIQKTLCSLQMLYMYCLNLSKSHNTNSKNNKKEKPSSNNKYTKINIGNTSFQTNFGSLTNDSTSNISEEKMKWWWTTSHHTQNNNGEIKKMNIVLEFFKSIGFQFPKSDNHDDVTNGTNNSKTPSLLIWNAQNIMNVFKDKNDRDSNDCGNNQEDSNTNEDAILMNAIDIVKEASTMLQSMLSQYRKCLTKLNSN